MAAVAGGWAVDANNMAAIAALVLLALFGLTLLFPSLADRSDAPLVALGASSPIPRATARTRARSSAVVSARRRDGLLWAPCAGPVLGLILTGAALHGANAGTTLLLLAYARGRRDFAGAGARWSAGASSPR